jgi:uncharacterized metal-binding protein
MNKKIVVFENMMADVAANNVVATANANDFASKLAAQLEKQTSKTVVIDKIVTIKDISPVITKQGELQENRRRIIDTAGVTHWCFTNQLASEKLAAGMQVVISYREKGEYINVLRVTPVLEKLNAQQLAYLSGNPIVIPAM